jgi:hypothetical protein
MKKLYVEGSWDKKFVERLIDVQSLSCIEKANVIDSGGLPKLLPKAHAEFKKQEEKYIGIVVDSDDDFSARIQSIEDSFQDILGNLTKQQVGGGIVFSSHKRKFGYYLMPSISQNGSLELFVPQLIVTNSIGDLAFKAAAQYINAAEKANPAIVAYTPNLNTTAKATFASWLALQEEPGSGYSSALNSKILDFGSPILLPFVQWFEALFAVEQPL